MSQIVQMSPQAAKMAETILQYGEQRKYQFAALEVGQSFMIDVSYKNASSRVWFENKKGGKQFVCVNHKEHGIIEIARIK